MSATAEAARNAGMEQVDSNATEIFRVTAQRAILATALINRELIVDDVWEHMPEQPQTHDLRAMGPAMVRAVKAGWLEATDRYRASAQVQCHANPRRIWRSLVCVA